MRPRLGDRARSFARRRRRRWSGSRCRPPAKNLEIKPYAISRLTTDLSGVARQCATNSTPDVGIDVKYGVTKSLTADFTYNTDFAQVEADEVAGEPDAVQPVVSREARVLPRRAGPLHVRRRRRRRARRCPGPAAPAAGRATRRRSSTAGGSASSAARAVPIVGGGRLIGKRWAVDHRRAQHHERPG